MTKDELHLAASGQKHAFIRDGALILYFDKAETPFVARFDLDSLAQANFEVADKKEGIYHLTLRDYSGETQTIGQFGSKTDAHQALYLILQALLEQPTGMMVVEEKPNLLWRFIKTLMKILAFIFAVLLILYTLARMPIFPENNFQPQPTAQSGENSVSEIPQGESFDADELLGINPSVPATEATE